MSMFWEASSTAAPNFSGSIHPRAMSKTIIRRTIIRLFETDIRKVELKKKKTAFYSFSVLNIRTEQIIKETRALTCEIWVWWTSTVLDFLLLLLPDRAVESDVGGWVCLSTHVSRRWGICEMDEKAAILSHHKLADCLLIDKLFSFSIYSDYAYFIDVIFLSGRCLV